MSYYDGPPKCDACGRFMQLVSGCAWQLLYDSGYPPCPDREIYRCLKCTQQHGPFHPQFGIKPEFSCGIKQ